MKIYLDLSWIILSFFPGLSRKYLDFLSRVVKNYLDYSRKNPAHFLLLADQPCFDLFLSAFGLCPEMKLVHLPLHNLEWPPEISISSPTYLTIMNWFFFFFFFGSTAWASVLGAVAWWWNLRTLGSCSTVLLICHLCWDSFLTPTTPALLLLQRLAMRKTPKGRKRASLVVPLPLWPSSSPPSLSSHKAHGTSTPRPLTSLCPLYVCGVCAIQSVASAWLLWMSYCCSLILFFEGNTPVVIDTANAWNCH